MKKTALLSLLIPLMGGLSACNQDNAKWHIGVCQLVTHDALDAATRGFKEELEKEFGADVKIDIQNASGESANCVSICNKFVSKNVDLIMANATPALQAAANSTTTIPILGTSITEYGVALNIDNFDGKTGRNISGTSDLAPLVEQVDMLEEIFPDANKVGLLYCASEANSKYQVDVVKAQLIEDGKTVEMMSFSDSNDIASVLRGKIDNLDVVYIPTDNTAASNAETIDSICREKKVPVVAGEEGICKVCGTVTLSIDYYNIGVETGNMAIDILKNGKDPKDMAIPYDRSPVKKFNKEICDALGITDRITSEYKEIK